MTAAVRLPALPVINHFAVPALRWGIAGPGWIAQNFVAALHRYTPQRAHAVASAGSVSRAQTFAAEFGIPRVYASYAELCQDPEIDAVYVANLHHDHVAATLLAIDAGKPVLVEKPLAVTPADAERVRKAAAEAGVLVVEAMWAHYLPQLAVVREAISSGLLGEIEAITAELGQNLMQVPRMTHPVSGGALLDVGIYPLSFITHLLGEPSSMAVVGQADADGLDLESVVALRYSGGVVGNALSSRRAFTESSAWVSGSRYLLELAGPFIGPTVLRLRERQFGSAVIDTVVDDTAIGHEGLHHEATAFAGYLAEGRTDSPIRPLERVIADIRLLDAARRSLGWHEPA